MRNGIGALVLAAAMITGGCSINVGNPSRHGPAGPTVGQELLDLKAARDKGVITEEEYEAKRQQLLKAEEE